MSERGQSVEVIEFKERFRKFINKEVIPAEPILDEESDRSAEVAAHGGEADAERDPRRGSSADGRGGSGGRVRASAVPLYSAGYACGECVGDV